MRRGFSVVEMLVVAAIVVILSLLMIPVLIRTKASSQKIVTEKTLSADATLLINVGHAEFQNGCSSGRCSILKDPATGHRYLVVDTYRGVAVTLMAEKEEIKQP